MFSCDWIVRLFVFVFALAREAIAWRVFCFLCRVNVCFVLLNCCENLLGATSSEGESRQREIKGLFKIKIQPSELLLLKVSKRKLNFTRKRGEKINLWWEWFEGDVFPWGRINLLSSLFFLWNLNDLWLTAAFSIIFSQQSNTFQSNVCESPLRIFTFYTESVQWCYHALICSFFVFVFVTGYSSFAECDQKPDVRNWKRMGPFLGMCTSSAMASFRCAHCFNCQMCGRRFTEGRRRDKYLQ